MSYVSVGDGSVNNAHFLAALNLAEYATHRNFYCPTVFGVSDNNISISLSVCLYSFLPPKLTSALAGVRMDGQVQEEASNALVRV